MIFVAQISAIFYLISNLHSKIVVPSFLRGTIGRTTAVKSGFWHEICLEDYSTKQACNMSKTFFLNKWLHDLPSDGSVAIMAAKQTSKAPARRWVFTLNNYGQFSEDAIKNYIIANCVYGVYGREVAPNTQTPHLQGFFAFKIRKRMNTIKRELSLPEIHLEKAISDVATNRKYCIKDGNFFEFGEIPKYKSGGTDMVQSTTEFIECMDTASSLNDYMRSHSKAWLLHGHHMIGNYYQAATEVKRDGVLAIWIHGPTGVGKSHFANNLLTNAYRKMPNTKWWHRYHLEKEVIVDELNHDSVDVSYWNTWLDKYPCSVETKGNEMPLHAILFVLTSNFHPSEIFPRNTAALLRRLTIFEVSRRDEFELVKQVVETHKIYLELTNDIVEPTASISHASQ